MEKLKNNKKIIIIIGVIILIIISIYVLTKIDEYNYEENNYEEYFAEEENIYAIEDSEHIKFTEIICDLS